jgi:peptide/nickel transport system permease protein
MEKCRRSISMGVAPKQLGLICRRIGLSLVTLILVSGLIFMATQGLPGDVARMILGKEAGAEQVEALRSQLGLNLPLVEQYTRWVGSLLSGDLGFSAASNRPVADLVGPRVANSFALVAMSMVLALPISVLLGVATANFKDTWFDRIAMAASLGVNALPEFVLGLLLVVVFSTNLLHVVPAVSLLSPGKPFYQQLSAYVLPVATLFLLQTTYLYRLVRGTMIDVLASDYVQFARLKGMSSGSILFRHALPNAAVPAIQAAANVFALSVGGVVVVEYVFGYPGMGTALTDAVGNRDIPVVQFIVLIIAATFLLSNMIADLAAALLTPPGRGA